MERAAELGQTRCMRSLAAPWSAVRSLLAPCAVIGGCVWVGCAPHGEALEPDSPVVQPPVVQDRPAVEPGPDPAPAGEPSPTRPQRPVAERVHTRAEPPAGAPRVTSSIAFDVLAADAKRPRVEPNFRGETIEWFLGSSSPNPAWSPDGHRIALFDGRCVTIRGDDGRLVGTLRTKIRDAGCNGPRWAPGGRAIATSHSFHGAGVLFELDAGARRAKRSAALRGPGNGGMWSVSFLPDGETLVGRVHQSGAALVPAHRAGPAMALVSDQVPTMQGYFPSFAPDGRHFARVLGEWGGPGDLEVAAINLASASHADVKDPWSSESHAGRMGVRTFVLLGPILEYDWSRDGAKLVAVRASEWYAGYDAYDYRFGELLSVDAATGAVQVLAEGAKNPSLSPDGRFVAFDAQEGDVRLVELAKPELGAWPLHTGGIEPRWSPAGHAIMVLDPRKQQVVVLKLGGA